MWVCGEEISGGRDMGARGKVEGHAGMEVYGTWGLGDKCRDMRCTRG